MKNNGDTIDERNLILELEKVIFENLLSKEDDTPQERERLHHFIVEQVKRVLLEDDQN